MDSTTGGDSSGTVQRGGSRWASRAAEADEELDAAGAAAARTARAAARSGGGARGGAGGEPVAGAAGKAAGKKRARRVRRLWRGLGRAGGDVLMYWRDVLRGLMYWLQYSTIHQKVDVLLKFIVDVSVTTHGPTKGLVVVVVVSSC